MAISGFTPTTALPGLMNGASLAGSNPLMAAPGSAGLIGGSPLHGAQAGAVEKPGLGARFMNAMKAAIGELRGVPTQQLQPTQPTQSLALQAPAPVTVKRPSTAPKRAVKGKTFTDKLGNVRQVGTGMILKPTTRPAASAAVPQQQLPVNATQVPGATVYSYDQNGNPVAPTMQQLGMTPTMLQGLEGMTGAVDPSGPQVNATNQTNVGGLGSGLGIGSAVPVLGAPIAVTPAATSRGDQPAGPAGTGGSQSVTNRNETDIANRNQGVVGGYPGWGGGWGGSPLNGLATPSAPYGASMTGAFVMGDRSRLI